MAVQNYGYLKTIWDGLLSWIKNEYGVSGLMGNLYAESGCVPFRVQGDLTFPFNYSTNYTARVNNGTVSEYAFVHNVPDSAHGKGYGLAQWTFYSRKQQLYNLYKNTPYSSIGGVDTGLAMLKLELDTGGSYASVGTVLKTATTVRQASDYAFYNYEAPADQSEAARQTRENYANEIYNMYQSGGGQPDPPTPDPPPPPYPVDPTLIKPMSIIYYLRKM